MFIRVSYLGSYPLGDDVELNNIKIMKFKWNEYNKTVFIFGGEKYIIPFFTQLFYVISNNNVSFFTAYEYCLGHYHIFAVCEKDNERLAKKVDWRMNIDFLEEEKFFDKLDEMIGNYHFKKNNNLNVTSLYDTFFELHNYICVLEEKGKIITNSNKSIKYLKEILLNDGPEYALTIKFESTAFTDRKYIIGICVRGEPLIKKID